MVEDELARGRQCEPWQARAAACSYPQRSFNGLPDLVVYDTPIPGPFPRDTLRLFSLMLA